MERRTFLEHGVASLLLMAIPPFGPGPAGRLGDLKLPEPGIVPLSGIPSALERINDRRQVLLAKQVLETFLDATREDYLKTRVDRVACIRAEQALLNAFPERVFPRRTTRVGVSGAGVGKFVFAVEFVVLSSAQIARVMAWHTESGLTQEQAEQIGGLALARVPLPTDLRLALEAV